MPTIEERVSDLESERRALRVTLENINRDLAHGRDRMRDTEGEVDALNETVEEIRRQMPILEMTSEWVRWGVVGVFSLVGLAVAALVIK